MKRIILTLTLIAGFLLVGTTVRVLAADSMAKKVTITGTAMCARCALHLTNKCHTVIQTKKDGKTVLYWLTPNKTAKAFHHNICLDPHQATATGTLQKKNGKEMLTVTKIELVKK